VEQKQVLLVYSAGRLNPKPKKLSSDRSSAKSFKERAEEIWLNKVDLGVLVHENTQISFQKTRQFENGIWRSEIQLAIIKKHKQAQAHTAETVDS
jgi:hypothetical protein